MEIEGGNNEQEENKMAENLVNNKQLTSNGCDVEALAITDIVKEWSQTAKGNGSHEELQ